MVELELLVPPRPRTLPPAEEQRQSVESSDRKEPTFKHFRKFTHRRDPKRNVVIECIDCFDLTLPLTTLTLTVDSVAS